MKGGKSYIKDTQDFLKRLKHLGKVPSNAILVTVDVVGLCCSILHEASLKALYEKLGERVEKKIPYLDLVNMAEFVMKSIYFDFVSKVRKQISGTALGTKFAPPDACIML